MPLLIRKLADKESGERVTRYDPITGEKKLVNPATPGEDHEPWPLAGVVFEGEAPDHISVPMDYVDQAVSEGWMERVGESAVVRPAGPKMNVWASSQTGTPHTFIQAKEIIFHMQDGDYRYKVVRNPDKYVADYVPTNDEKGLVDIQIDKKAKVTPELYEQGLTAVAWDYELERIDG